LVSRSGTTVPRLFHLLPGFEGKEKTRKGLPLVDDVSIGMSIMASKRI